MAEEDDRWALEHLKEVDERGQSFGVGTFRMKDEDGLTHRVTWSRVTGCWARMCDHMMVKRKVLRDKEAVPDPGAVTCFQCLGKGA